MTWLLPILYLSSIFTQEEPVTIPNEPGTYVIWVGVSEDPEFGKPITITVLLPTSYEDTQNFVAIDASDIILTPDEFSALTDAFILEKSKAKAWDTRTGESLEIKVASQAKVTEIHYEVMLQSKETYKKINIYILEKPTVSYTYNNHETVHIAKAQNPLSNVLKHFAIFMIWLLIPLLTILVLISKLSRFNRNVDKVLYRKD